MSRFPLGSSDIIPNIPQINTNNNDDSKPIESNKLKVTEIFIIILVGWVVIDIFTNAANNILFGLLPLNRDDWLDSSVAAIIALVFFMILLYYIDERIRSPIEKYFGITT